MDGVTILNQVISGGIIVALTGIVSYLFKINSALARLMTRQEQQDARLMLLEADKPISGNGQHRVQIRTAKRGGALTWALILLAILALSTLSGCQLLGLDLEQAQRDTEETSQAMELLVEKAEVISDHIARLEDSWQQAEAGNNIEQMIQIWPKLQTAYQDSKLTKTELAELQAVFHGRVAAFREAKDTTGYLQAALGLLAGAASAFFPGLGMIRRRNRIIKTTARNVEQANGNLDRIKMLQKNSLLPDEVLLLDSLRQ